MSIEKTKSNVMYVDFSKKKNKGGCDDVSAKKFLSNAVMCYPYFLRIEKINYEDDIRKIKSVTHGLMNALDCLKGDELLKTKWLAAHYSLLITQIYEVRSKEWDLFFVGAYTLLEEMLEETEEKIKIIDMGVHTIVLPISAYGLNMQISRFLTDHDLFMCWYDYACEKISELSGDISLVAKSRMMHVIFKNKLSYQNDKPIFSVPPVIASKGRDFY